MAGTVHQRNQNHVVAGGCSTDCVGSQRGAESELGGLGSLDGELSLNCDSSIKHTYEIEQNLPASSSQHPPLYLDSM